MVPGLGPAPSRNRADDFVRLRVDHRHFLGLRAGQAQRRPLPVTRAAGDRKQIDKPAVRRHHGVVPDAQGVDVLDDLFLLRVEHLPVAGVRRLIQEAAVGRDGAVLRFGAKATSNVLTTSSLMVSISVTVPPISVAT